MGGFKGFPHTITYRPSTMHFKQFQDDLVKENGKNRCGDLKKYWYLWEVGAHCHAYIFTLIFL